MGQSMYKNLVFLPPSPTYEIGQSLYGVLIEPLRCPDGTEIPFVLIRPDVGHFRDYVLLYSHGNAEDLGQMIPLMNRLADEFGISTATYDYLGYGPTQGTASPGELHCFTDIETAYRHLRHVCHFDPSKIVLFGRSLGTGPTVHLAKLLSDEGLAAEIHDDDASLSSSSKQGQFGAVILQSPLISAVSVVSELLSAFAPDMFENLKKILHVRRPVVILHGTDDKVIPFAHGKKLADALASADRDAAVPRLVGFTPLPGAGHNDIEMFHWLQYRAAIAELLERLREDEALRAQGERPFWIGSAPPSGFLDWFSPSPDHGPRSPRASSVTTTTAADSSSSFLPSSSSSSSSSPRSASSPSSSSSSPDETPPTSSTPSASPSSSNSDPNPSEMPPSPL